MMTSPRRQRVVLLLTVLTMAATGCAAAGPPGDADVPESCTVLLITDGQRVLGGGNEDQDAFPARAWFIPASEGKHGRLCFGFEGVVESGMNDQGLFYDSLAVRGTDVSAEEGKDTHRGMWTMRALEICSTVEEVIAFIDGIGIPGTWTDQLFFGDRNGHSIIVEGKTVIRPERNFQVCTNFAQTRTARDEIACDRYLAAERKLGEMEVVSFDAVRDVFAATAAAYEDGSGTAYTAIYDPIALTAALCFRRDFQHPLRFDLRAELARGPHVVELEALAPPKTRRVPWVIEAQAELEGRIEARIDRALLDRSIAQVDLVGHYAVDPAMGVVPIPPVMLEAVSIVWEKGDDRLPQLVVAPEGIYFDLRPAGEDVWFHVNATAKPEIDVALQRNDAGRTVGATITIIGLGEIPLVKVSDQPAYEPLPSAMLPAGGAGLPSSDS